MPKTKKIVIDPDKCIGCNTCPLLAPEIFELNTDTYKAVVKSQPAEITKAIEDAIASCPVGAISIIEE